eukprot:6194854-Heterocapsa_arctica.AAC.1
MLRGRASCRCVGHLAHTPILIADVRIHEAKDLLNDSGLVAEPGVDEHLHAILVGQATCREQAVREGLVGDHEFVVLAHVERLALLQPLDERVHAHAWRASPGLPVLGRLLILLALGLIERVVEQRPDGLQASFFSH